MHSKKSYKTDEVPSIGIWKYFKDNRFLSNFASLLDPPDPVIIRKKNRTRINKLLRSLKPGEKSLNVGSGSNRYNKDIINFDLCPECDIDIGGDSAYLPFKPEIFNVIICQAVLEHVEEPNQTVKEIYRVLKKGGMVYIETPFFQGYHAAPNDFQRYTISGIQNLFRDFELVEKGVLAGPSSALAWTLREFLAILFCFNNLYLYRSLNLIFGWMTTPIKYIDIFLENNRFAPVIASGFFLLGKKR